MDKGKLKTKCEHCGTVNANDAGNCTSCGARLPEVLVKMEQRLLAVSNSRAAEARVLASKCGYSEVSAVRVGDKTQIKLERNVNTPYHGRIVSLTNEVFLELDPPQPRRGYIVHLVFFIISMFTTLTMFIPTIVVSALTSGTDASVAVIPLLVIFLVFLAVSLMFMAFMIRGIVRYKNGKKEFDSQIRSARDKADLCEKIILGSD